MLFFVKTDRIKAADKPDKPAVTITMKDSTATITIGCTKGADGYKILVNAPGDTKFKKMAFPLVVNMNQGKSAVSNLPLLTYGQSLDDSLNAVLHVGSTGSHRTQNLAGQSGEDVGFHSAA